jgi:hypothetical protein
MIEPELWVQVGPRRVGRIRGVEGLREICDAYNNPGYMKRDGVLAAWLVDPNTKKVIHGQAPKGWETFDH